MNFRVLAGSGLVLLFSACMVVVALPWVAVACAIPAFGIGFYLDRNQRLVDGDALHLVRIALFSGGAMTILAALHLILYLCLFGMLLGFQPE